MGYVALDRKLSEHPIWLMEPFTYGQAWADLIMLANHKPGFIKVRGIVISVNRGQVGRSALTLSARWKWSRGKTLRYFDFLVQQNMITIEQQNIKLSSIITILKYNEYQLGGTTNDTTEQDIRRTSDGHQTDTNNKDKKDKNEKKIFVAPTVSEVSEYCTERKNGIDPEKFIAYYEARGWMLGKEKIKSWKACIITWEKNGYSSIPAQSTNTPSYL